MNTSFRNFRLGIGLVALLLIATDAWARGGPGGAFGAILKGLIYIGATTAIALGVLSRNLKILQKLARSAPVLVVAQGIFLLISFKSFAALFVIPMLVATLLFWTTSIVASKPPYCNGSPAYVAAIAIAVTIGSGRHFP